MKKLIAIALFLLPVIAFAQTSKPVLQKQVEYLQDSLDVRERVVNKATTLTSPDNTTYPTTQAVVDALSIAPTFYNSNGTLTGSRTVNGNNYNLEFNSLNGLSVFTNGSAQLQMGGDSIVFKSRNYLVRSYSNGFGTNFNTSALTDDRQLILPDSDGIPIFRINGIDPDLTGSLTLTIPTVNNATISIKNGATTLGSFTTNQGTTGSIDISSAIPSTPGLASVLSISGSTGAGGTITFNPDAGTGSTSLFSNSIDIWGFGSVPYMEMVAAKGFAFSTEGNANNYNPSLIFDSTGINIQSKSSTGFARLRTDNIPSGTAPVFQLPNAPGGGTLALTSDITTPTLQQVTDEGSITTNVITTKGILSNPALGSQSVDNIKIAPTTGTGYLSIGNGTSGSNFYGQIRGNAYVITGSAPFGLNLLATGSDSYTIAGVVFSAYNAAGTGAITGGNILSIRNYTTTEFSVDYNGNIYSSGLSGTGSRLLQADASGNITATIPIYKGSYSVSSTAIAANSQVTLGTTTITGAAAGQVVIVSQPTNAIIYKARVTLPNTVTIYAINPTISSINTTAETINIIIQ